MTPVLVLTCGHCTLAASESPFDWQEKDHYRVAKLVVPESGAPGFTRLDAQLTEVAFANQLAQSRYRTNQIYLNGSGVACGDVDGDGRVDLFFSGLDNRNALYRNLGDFRFEEVAEESGVGAAGLDCTAASLVDLDGDDDLDLLVNTVGQGTHVFSNDGRGRFTWLTRSGAPNAGKGGMSMALADVEGDGDLDLYVTNYRTWTRRDRPQPQIRGNWGDGKPVVVSFDGRPVTDPDLVGRFTLDMRGKIVENGEIDALFLNDGKGGFVLASFNDGRFLDETGSRFDRRPFDWGLSVMFRDMNGDRAPDIYVCNDFSAPDRIWINDGEGRFRAIPELAIRTTSRFSMGVDFADIDRDGDDDILVMDMMSRSHQMRQVQLSDPPLAKLEVGGLKDRPQASRNTLLLNRGDDTYAEVAFYSGLHASEWSWTAVFLDVDLDGYEDVLITNGHERDALNADVREWVEQRSRPMEVRIKEIREQIKRGIVNSRSGSTEIAVLQRRILELSDRFERLANPNAAFRNLGDLKFEDVSELWGFNSTEVSHGMALADLDNDGDLDVVTNNLNGPAGLYRNESPAPRLAIRLNGLAPNTRGIGATIRVTAQGGSRPISQTQEMMCGGRYLSSDDAIRTFAAFDSQGKFDIEVTWRSGKTSLLQGVPANRIYEINETSAADPSPGPVPRDPRPLFEDVSDLLDHTHHEEFFDDMQRQPLLPRRLSQPGPGISWIDLNGDGAADLLIGSGRGGRIGVFYNTGNGSFQRSQDPPFHVPITRDQTSILAWPRQAGDMVILAGSANYEDGLAMGASVRAFDLKAKRVDDRQFPAQPGSVGPMAFADYDADADLDLFVGGRVIGGKYPAPVNSRLWRNTKGRWTLDEENSSRLKNVGLVTGCVWSDLNDDGFSDLILACEWGPIRVFENQQGVLRETTERWGLDQYLGWWNGINAGDLDGDGRLDLVASNWGWNHSSHAIGAETVRLYWGEFGSVSSDVVEAYRSAALGDLAPLRNLKRFSQVWPDMRQRYPTFTAFSEASVSAILGNHFSNANQLEVSTFASMVFLNRGNRFEARELPLEAQLSPGFGVNIADANGDGLEDVFISQNFFSVNPDEGRLDAGRGLWMIGDGKGSLEPLGGMESGVAVYGEQRGSAVADFDRDGRLDLAVTQNGAATKLYRNVGAKPGLRVRLYGGQYNPGGVGAMIRLIAGGQKGPAREVHGGGGYLSGDGMVQVFGYAEFPSEIEVRWPGGKTTNSKIPTSAREILVNLQGVVTKVH